MGQFRRSALSRRRVTQIDPGHQGFDGSGSVTRGIDVNRHEASEGAGLERAVRTLRDEKGVCDALYRFAEGIDLRDWVTYRSAFTDNIEFDYSSYREGSRGIAPADTWVEKSRKRFLTLDATQHSMTNPRVRLDGDAATCLMYVEAWHSVTIDGTTVHCVLGGRYRNDLVRVGEEWRISALRLEVRWVQGDRSILDR